MTEETRTSRNEMLFGAAGQQRIRATSVAIVGLGGLGSHVAQQLAYLGSEEFVIVDHDRVSLSNLNRLIGAGPQDAVAETAKVDVATRLIQLIQPGARVRAFDAWINDADAQAAVLTCSVVFGCLDSDPARLALLEVAAPSKLPYIDIASDVSIDGTQYGGRLLFSVEGKACLFCMGMLDQAALRRATETLEQAAEDERIYGIRPAVLGTGGPSVVSVNGVVASLAVTEFMAWITGMREPQRYLVYHAESGLVTRSLDHPLPRCPYCGR